MTNVIQMERTQQDPGLYLYWPEMKEKKPDCQMEAMLSYYGNHYIVDTPIEIKGRGITEQDVSWVHGSRKGLECWHSYQVTERAFEKLKEKYSISMRCLLD